MPVGVQRVAESLKVNLKTPDYELEGLPWIIEYHMLKNKRYIITNNSRGVAQVWNIGGCKFVKTYHSKDFAGVKEMMNDKYDLQPTQTPYPQSWFSVDVKLGCLSIHLDEDNWHKCVVSDLLTNIQLMISQQHHMDHGTSINYDIEEK